MPKPTLLEGTPEQLDRSVLEQLGDGQRMRAAADAFLSDHRDLSRNVFVMMRFSQTPQMLAITEAIRSTLRQRNYHAIRADDRDYTGDLWMNAELCARGCELGLAVLEDVHRQGHDLNIALELGFMRALQRRCLILREQTLPQLPTMLVHRFYRTFDMFDIEASIERSVSTWLEVDIRDSAMGHTA
jgi:hypothetical protein